jgi:HK97 family phage portal protein
MALSTSAGVNMSQESSLRVNAVYAAVRLYADTVSMLPVDTYYRAQGERRPFRPKPDWIENPDPDGLTRQQFLAQWMVSKLISHAACVRVLRGDDGAVVALSVLDPRRVERKRDANGKIIYIVQGAQRPLTSDEVIYDTEMLQAGQLMGTSRVDQIRETLGLTQALETFASMFFGNGTAMAGIVEIPGEATQEQAKSLQDSIEKGHKGLRKAHRPGVLSGGAKWVKTSVDPDEAQMLGSREFALEEIARAFRIPPNMLQSQKPGSVAYASREQDAIQFLTYSLLPYVTAIESHLSRLLPGGAFIKFNVDALLRASLSERFAAYAQAVQSGFITINRINTLEDWPKVEGGDSYRVPLANVDLSAASLTETQMKVDMAVKLVAAGFTPDAACAAVDLPPIAFAEPPEPPEVEPADPADDAAEDDAEDPPTRTIRSVVRDEHGFITAVIDESVKIIEES